MAPQCDLVVNLGDIVGYGASPNEVTEQSRSLGKFFVRGNHDKAVTGLTDLNDFNPVAGVAALWTREQLTADNSNWLRALPRGPVMVPDIPDVEFVHGSPLDEDEYVVNSEEAAASLREAAVADYFFWAYPFAGWVLWQWEQGRRFLPGIQNGWQERAVGILAEKDQPVSDQSRIRGPAA